MPTLEALEYERFSYDERPLTLDEALAKAAELRRKDSSNFYRIEHINEGRTAFRIKKVSATSVYADFAARVAKALGKYRFRSR